MQSLLSVIYIDGRELLKRIMKRIQNRIAESRYALPVVSVIGACVCMAAGLITRQLWPQFGVLALSTYIMVLMNNQHAIIRIYSRMVSCAFLVLSLTALFLFPHIESGVIALGYAAFYTLLFHSYQDKHAAGFVFYAFLCLGIVSMMWMRVLWLVPVLWILLASKMLAFSMRTLVASLIGLVFPYWLVSCYLAYTHQLSLGFSFLSSFVEIGPLADFSSLPIMVVIVGAWVLLLGIVGICHYLHTSYNDRISTRMIYEFLVIMQIVLSLFVVLQPQCYAEILPMLLVNTSPLIAHFIALSHGKMSNVSFIVIVLISVALILCNFVLC